jgi:hypothetical protein
MTAPADKHEMHQEHLAQADAAIAEGNEHIAKQRAIMAPLQARGHDLSEATALLERSSLRKSPMRSTAQPF